MIYDEFNSSPINTTANIYNSGVNTVSLNIIKENLSISKEVLHLWKSKNINDNLVNREHFILLKEILEELKKLNENIEKIK